MRRLIHAGLMLSIAALPLMQACAAPAQNSPAPLYTSGAPLGAGYVRPVSDPGSAAGSSVKEFDPTGYKVDSAQSQALSDYLTQHKLPLVGAQVMHGPDEQRGVVLYGFVGSDFGKQDAVKKARNFLSDSNVAVDNRIKVNPELLTSSSGSPAAGNDGGSPDGSGDNNSNNEAPMPSYPGADSYTQNQQSQTQQYVQNQNSNATLSTMAPMLLLGMMALSIASGGAFSVGPGSFGPPGSSFGGPPPSQYPGFPSPPGYGGPPSGPFGP